MEMIFTNHITKSKFLKKIDEWGQNTELFTPKSIKELQQLGCL